MYIKTSKNVSGNIIKKIKKDYKKIAPERHLNLFKENKRKKWKYCCERYKNLLEDKKKKNLGEYRKKYYKMRKSALL